MKISARLRMTSDGLKLRCPRRSYFCIWSLPAHSVAFATHGKRAGDSLVIVPDVIAYGGIRALTPRGTSQGIRLRVIAQTTVQSGRASRNS